jgi:hypothetical protein
MPAMLHNGDGAICVYVPAGRLHRALLEMQNLIGTPPFGRRFHLVYPRRTRRRESKTLQHHSRTSDRQRLRGIELSITAPRTFRARVNHYAAMRAALKTLPRISRCAAAVCTPKIRFGHTSTDVSDLN